MFQALSRHRHGVRLLCLAIRVCMAPLRLQLAICSAVLRWCPPLRPLAYRRAVSITTTARRYRLQLEYLKAEM